MRLPRTVSVALASALVVTACVAGLSAPPTAGPSSPPATASASVLPAPAFSEVGVGKNRMLWSFLNAEGTAPVAAPDRTLRATFAGPGGETVGPIDGNFIWAIEDERGVYELEADFPVAGAWTASLETSVPGAPTDTVEFGFDVKADTSVVRPGEDAPSVDTPTGDDVGGDLAKLSTDPEPDPELYETSVADALAAGTPFVLAFATPKFCRTAQCGPTLDRLKPIAAAHPDVAFINVEPYELELVDGQLQPVLTADRQLQAVPAVRAYGLLSEPYVFVVGRDGKVASSFEVVFSEEELDAAVAAVE